MPEDILNPRRGARFAVRCAVEIRHRLDVWSGETEDVGAGGCQIVTRRVVDPGRNVRLAIRCDAASRTFLAAGTVVWTRANAPARLGVAFLPGLDAKGWLEALAKARPGIVRAQRSVPARLPRSAAVFLGRPPELVIDFTATELDILRRVGSGATLDTLARSFGGEMDEQVRGALFTLVARGALVLDAAAAADHASWKRVLAARDVRVPAPTPAPGRTLAVRAPEVQRLYDEALAHIGGGRLALAMDRLRDALEHAPDDATIASTARRISRWA